MGRRKNIDIQDEEMKDDIKKLLKGTAGKTLDDIRINKPTVYINTGVKSLNYIISGDIERGIPNSRVIQVYGDAQTGKSLLVGLWAKNALKDNGFSVHWFDTEYSDVDFFHRIGFEGDDIIIHDVDCISDFLTKFNKLVENADEQKIKLFMVLDSLTLLLSEKEFQDNTQNKFVGNQGQREKDIKAMLRRVMNVIGKSEHVFIFTNHGYVDPTSFGHDKKPSGGHAVMSMPHIVLLLRRLVDQDDKENTYNLKCKTDKNRVFIEKLTTEFKVNNVDGINDNIGLLNLLYDFKVIDRESIAVTKKRFLYIYKDQKYKEEEIFSNEELLKNMIEEFKENCKSFQYHKF